MTVREQIVAAARRYVGTPFRHQGRQHGIGIDCAGLVVCVGREAGLMPDYREIAYGRQPNPQRMRAQIERYADEIQPRDVQPGDLYWMRFIEPMHMAIATRLADGRAGMIHAYADAGRCVEHGLDDTWRRRIVRAYRYRGVE